MNSPTSIAKTVDAVALAQGMPTGTLPRGRARRVPALLRRGLASLALLALIALGPASVHAQVVDGGYVYVNPGLHLLTDTDSGKLILATAAYIPSQNAVDTPNPSVDWGDGTVESVGVNINIFDTQSDCYIEGGFSFGPERCELRNHHVYHTPGDYTITVAYYVGALISYTTTLQATVTPATAIQPVPHEITPLAGKPFGGPVALFADSNTLDAASLFSATLDWGDGNTSIGVVSGADAYFGVSGGDHVYASAGVYTIDAKLSYPGGPTIDAYSTAVVAAPPAHALPAPPVTATLGRPVTAALGNFTIDGAVSRPADYRASIDWGDGTPPDTNGKIGPVTSPPGEALAFSVTGTHTYASLGTFSPVVTVTTLGGGDPLPITADFTVASCTTPSPATSAYAKAVLASQPAGYWRLDAGCAADSSGHGLRGTLEGGLTATPAGAPALDVSGATGFDGQTSAISLDDPAALQPANVSVEAWVNTTHGNSIVVRKRFYGYVLLLDASGRPVFGIDDANAVEYAAHGATSVTDGAWHYLTGTYDGKQVCVYSDGALSGTCANAATIHYTGDQVTIGRDGSAPGGYFSGSIDDVAIYPRALSAADVRAHAAAAKQATTTTLSTSGSTVVATVTGADGRTPVGSVTLEDGGTALKTVAVSQTGTATFPLSGLTAGRHSLVAVYNGDDPNSAGSTSSALSVAVTAVATTTSVSTSDNNAPHFAPLTFTATVRSAGSGQPTGSVTFLDNGAALGSATLTNGVASIRTKGGALAPGVHTITAVYAGDGPFGSSTAQPIKQIVQGNG